MSIELKQAAQQALDALVKSKNALEVLWVSHHANRTDYAIEDIESAIEALRAAIQQAEAKTDVPVAWLYIEDGEVMFSHPNGYRPPDARPLVFGDTHPAPGVPDAIKPPAENGTEYDYCSGRAAGYAEGWNDCRAAILTAASNAKGES